MSLVVYFHPAATVLYLYFAHLSRNGILASKDDLSYEYNFYVGNNIEKHIIVY